MLKNLLTSLFVETRADQGAERPRAAAPAYQLPSQDEVERIVQEARRARAEAMRGLFTRRHNS